MTSTPIDDLELAAAERAVRKHAPPGMGGFSVREIARVALEAAQTVRLQRERQSHK